MNVVTWDPFRDINQIFNRNGQYRAPADAEPTDWSPLVDIYEAADKFLLRTELPGVEKDAVSVSIDESVLTIKGTKQFIDAKDGEKWKRVEAKYGEFTRKFTLPDDVDTDQVSAAYKNGVLELSIPKVEPKKVKLIDVKVH